MKQEYAVNVQGKAYILHPEIPEKGSPRPLRPGESGGQLAEPLRTYAEQAGLAMRRPPLTPYTMYSLEATEYAQQKGQFDAFHLAAYRAFWEEGKDLGDMRVIEELAVKCDLDWVELSERLESGYHRNTIIAQHQEAIDLGIRGIPAFFMGNVLFTGAQPYEIFKLAIARARDGFTA